MAIKSYVITQTVKSPYVQVTGMPHKPQAIKFKQFQKGEIVRGEMKHANNQPAFLLVNGCCVVPLSCVREIITKEVTSNAAGDGKADVKSEVAKLPVKISKLKIMDAGIIGALAGLGAVWFAHKQEWLPMDKKNFIYGGAIGAAAGMYLLYRFKPSFKKPETKE